MTPTLAGCYDIDLGPLGQACDTSGGGVVAAQPSSSTRLHWREMPRCNAGRGSRPAPFCRGIRQSMLTAGPGILNSAQRPIPVVPGDARSLIDTWRGFV